MLTEQAPGLLLERLSRRQKMAELAHVSGVEQWGRLAGRGVMAALRDCQRAGYGPQAEVLLQLPTQRPPLS